MFTYMHYLQSLRRITNAIGLQQPKHATAIPCISLLKASRFQLFAFEQRSQKQAAKVLKKAEGRKS